MRFALGFCLLALSATAAANAKDTMLWAGCGITKKAFMAELATAYQRKTGIEIVMEGGGAAKGIRRVADRSVALGGTCRPKLPNREDELHSRLNPVAWDALTVITHPDNPIKDISMDELRAVYDGLITNWVVSVFTDSRGRVWIGTDGGVNLYDGTQLTRRPELGSEYVERQAQVANYRLASGKSQRSCQ